MFACTGGFDSGVECQQVGLIGNGLDVFRQVGDLLGIVGGAGDGLLGGADGGGQPFHGVLGFGNQTDAVFRSAADFTDVSEGYAGLFDDVSGQLIHAS